LGACAPVYVADNGEISEVPSGAAYDCTTCLPVTVTDGDETIEVAHGGEYVCQGGAAVEFLWTHTFFGFSAFLSGESAPGAADPGQISGDGATVVWGMVYGVDAADAADRVEFVEDWSSPTDAEISKVGCAVAIYFDFDSPEQDYTVDVLVDGESIGEFTLTYQQAFG